jgi:hypothetical protein
MQTTGNAGSIYLIWHASSQPITGPLKLISVTSAATSPLSIITKASSPEARQVEAALLKDVMNDFLR